MNECSDVCGEKERKHEEPCVGKRERLSEVMSLRKRVSEKTCVRKRKEKLSE